MKNQTLANINMKMVDDIRVNNMIQNELRGNMKFLENLNNSNLEKLKNADIILLGY